jgi:predicted MPP superfamily phosphohydrolase
MMLDRLILVPLAVGHLALFVVFLNITHGLGYAESTLGRVKIAFLAVFTAGSALLGWEIARGSVASWSLPSLVYGSICVVTGLLLVPICSAYLHLRPRPPGLESRGIEVDLAAGPGRESLIGKGHNAWMLRLPGNESLRLRKVEWDVPIPGLPPALDGVSILHFSDLHLARCFDRRFFEAVFEEASSLESDLHLFTGDLVDDDGAVDWVVPLMSRLRGRVGSFAVLGNHDVDHQPEKLLRALEESGYTPVEGRCSSVSVAGATVAIAGTSYPWGPRLDPEACPAEADFRILLSHVPDQFYWAERAGFHLMLSGHNHGGQVRLPLIGSVVMPSVYSRRFDRGFFRLRGLTLHVSQGIGANHPIRYRCVPEIGRLVLRCGPSAARSRVTENAGMSGQFRLG